MIKLQFSCIFVALYFLSYAQYAQYVNPFIGTGGHGHTFPGPTLPFAMVQLSPDTRLEGWDGCSGYHYSDSIIYGFSHTHLSGTGIPDYCDVLLMPSSGKISFSNNPNSTSNYTSDFDKKNELAKLSYYEVLLNKHHIKVRLTTTTRTGLHEYSFPAGSDPWIIIDLQHRDKLLKSSFVIKNDNQISGTRISTGWAKEQHIYFSLQTSIPFSKYRFNDDSTKLILQFQRPKNGKISVQCAISPVDMAGAENNLKAEWKNFNFEKTYKENLKTWDNFLSRVNVKDNNNTNKTIFYTALYHTLIQANLYQDADQRYRGMDKQIHVGNTLYPRYTVFSLWDTYRATHPLYQLLYPEYNKKFVMSFLGQYQECGRLPVWELAGNETFCMVGNHSIAVIANALLNEPDNYSVLEKKELIEAIEKTLLKNYSGSSTYLNQGFISTNDEAESVSKTLEDALDFYAYTILSPDNANFHNASPYYYRNLFNPETGFFQAKLNHRFLYPFDPKEVNHHFTEANAWQYLFSAQHDISGLISLMDESLHENITSFSKYNFEQRLDSLFMTSSTMTGRDQSDITGLIGQYAHGNEPSHHLAYLYNYCGASYKTQNIIHQIRNEFYKNNNEGLCGNEDCGQMSAWYIFSAFGFYPVNPVSTLYDIGLPLFEEIRIQLPNKNPIIIKANKSTGAKYISSLNNSTNWKSPIELNYGSKLDFILSAKPHKLSEIDKKKTLQYFSEIGYYKKNYVPIPYVKSDHFSFTDSMLFDIKGVDPQQKYIFSLDNKETENTGPAFIKDDRDIWFRSSGNEKWYVTKFVKHSSEYTIVKQSQAAQQYSSSNAYAILDGLNGSSDFRDGYWLGYWGQDVEYVIKSKQAKIINNLSIRCLQDANAWIVAPKEINIFASEDSIHYQLIQKTLNKPDFDISKQRIFTFNTEKPFNATWIKIQLINAGPLMPPHPSVGGKTWIFVDEINIK